ncbi:MAG TPA: hypothetical protein VHY84_06005 [Bryobacteraceae bacterium]|nr:hypothetical protein [Bryobacteraceae bacterium]
MLLAVLPINLCLAQLGPTGGGGRSGPQGPAGPAPSGTGAVVVNSGVASAVVVSGDGTLNPATGALTVRSTNGSSFATVATSGSANDLTTGTLPHARLPVLLSGDIPANAANTSGSAATATALASTPALCPVGSYTLGINVMGNAQSCTTLPTFPTGTIVGTSDTQTLTNKTLDGVSPTIMGYVDATSSIQTQLNGKASSTGSTSVNGQPCQLSSTCNVNSGAVAHGVAINEGNGNAIAGTAAGAAHQFLASGGSGADPGYQDDRDVRTFSFAACVNGSPVASGQVSYISGAFTPVCSGGTNNKLGFLQQIPSPGGEQLQFMTELPDDWDTGAQPFINVYFTSRTNISGTATWTAASACIDVSTNGSGTDDPAFNSESAFAAVTFTAISRMWYVGGQLTQMTSGNGCKRLSPVIIRLTLSGTAASSINGYQAVLTIPTQPNPAQAN